MADNEDKAVASPEAGAPAADPADRVVRIQNPVKSAATAAKGRWSDFLDTSYDGSIVWAVRRGCQWVGVFFKSLKGLSNGRRGE